MSHEAISLLPVDHIKITIILDNSIANSVGTSFIL